MKGVLESWGCDMINVNGKSLKYLMVDKRQTVALQTAQRGIAVFLQKKYSYGCNRNITYKIHWNSFQIIIALEPLQPRVYNQDGRGSDILC